MMGQLRNALRAFAFEHDDPHDGRLAARQARRGDDGVAVRDARLPRRRSARAATCAVRRRGPSAAARPRAGRHDVVPRAAGARSRSASTRRSTFEAGEAQLEQGSTILLYTDGLVERRGMPLDEGLAPARRSRPRRARTIPRSSSRRVLGALIGDNERPDDIAVLAIRFAAAVVDDLGSCCPSTQDGLVEMRDGASRLARATGRSTRTRRPRPSSPSGRRVRTPSSTPRTRRSRSFGLRATLDDAGRMRIEVRDSGQWKPGDGSAERGLGLGSDALVHGHGRGEPGRRRDDGRDGATSSTRRTRFSGDVGAGTHASMHRPYSASEAHRLLVESRPVEDGVAMVELQGEADLHTAPILRDALNEAIESEPETLVVDLTGVTFIDSMMLGVLLERDAAGASARHRAADRRRRPARAADLRADAARPRDEALPEHRGCARRADDASGD